MENIYPKNGRDSVAVWAGLECTINRVGDCYFDQLARNGHYDRSGDIDLLAGLNIQAIRYPVLWERHQPVNNVPIDWSATEQRLSNMRSHGITAIAGLVHHGSGPEWVNFYDGSFEQGLAAYALQVATQFPWLEYYTPINEPLTTARFCGLYGLWYPHGHSDEQFARVLVAECKATVLAMAAIRRVNPNAKLVQTDDLGKVYSSAQLGYQAGFENERRWLAWDLVAGKVTPAHKLWNYLLWSGIDESELYFLLEHATPPAIIGVNHYVTSTRYLDDNLDRYPAHMHGGNGIHQYTDVEAVRVMADEPIAEPKELLREAWERYQLPVAVTEAHLHCSREQQGRWFLKVWNDANDLKNEGVDIRAVTAWAAFGSHGWNNLLTRPDGDYETGLFDTRSGAPRATAMAGLVKTLSTAGSIKQHPSFYGDGWWEKPSRVFYGPREPDKEPGRPANGSMPLLILGRNGTLGKAFSRICNDRHIHYVLWGREEMDMNDEAHIMSEKLAALNPWAVINATGFVRVDAAEQATEDCYNVNTAGAVKLATACKISGIRLLSFSSDLVFDGTKGSPYFESDLTAPLSVYGRSKALAEAGISAKNEHALIIRTSAFFSPWDEYNFVTVALREIRAGRRFQAAEDVTITPTYVPDLVHQCLDLLIDDEHGIWHLSNGDPVSWAGMAGLAARMSGLDEGLIEMIPQAGRSGQAQYPSNSALASIHGRLMPSLESALQRYLADLSVSQSQSLVPAFAG